MNKLILATLAFLFLIIAVACKKDKNEPVDTQIANYISENNLTVETSASGLRYYIENEGEGEYLLPNSWVTAVVKASYVNGEVLSDSNTPITFYASSQRDGLFEGIKKLKKNGRGIFIVPPSLSSLFPKKDQNVDNAIVYEVEIQDINNDVQEEIETYLAENNIDAQQTEHGLYYVVLEAGAEAKPTIDNSVRVTYIGRLLNGVVFDQTTTPITFGLSRLIRGWQIGIPFVGRGGTVQLICPPQLAYGTGGTGNIPGHSVLVFDVTLLGF